MMLGSRFPRQLSSPVLTERLRVYSKCASTRLVSEKVVGPKPDQPDCLLQPCYLQCVYLSISISNLHVGRHKVKWVWINLKFFCCSVLYMKQKAWKHQILKLVVQPYQKRKLRMTKRRDVCTMQCVSASSGCFTKPHPYIFLHYSCKLVWKQCRDEAL